MKGYSFRNLEHLTKWLEQTTWGQSVIRDVLAGPNGSRFYDEFVERELSGSDAKPMPTYVIVELNADGFVRVYGENHVRAVIVQRPASTSKDLATIATLIDQWILLSLKPSYQAVYWPSYCRASGQIERMTVRQMAERENKREMELAVIRCLNKLGGK